MRRSRPSRSASMAAFGYADWSYNGRNVQNPECHGAIGRPPRADAAGAAPARGRRNAGAGAARSRSAPGIGAGAHALPASSCTAPCSSRRPAPPGRCGSACMSRGRVLIVDDEPDMVENCARILKREGYECLTANDGRRALEILESARPDLLLTDLSMPELDGHGAAAPGARGRPGLAGHHDHRVREHRVRGGGREGGRVRLPAQDLLRGSAPGGGGARRTAPELAGGKPQPARAAPGDARARQHHRPQPGHDPGVRAGQEGGALGGQHPGARRVRDGQGADRPRDPRQ